MTHDITQEAVERAIALVRRMADPTAERMGTTAEARAIVALLPAIDPDLIEARTIMALSCDWLDKDAVMAGSHDADPIQCGALTGIKRGRELAKGDGK